MKKLILLATIGMLLGCANQDGPPAGEYGQDPAVAPIVVPGPTPSESAEQTMVDKENTYRNSIGQQSLYPGLTCTLYTVPTTTTAIIGATLTAVGSFSYAGVFNQANIGSPLGINVLPAVLQPLYTQNYVIKCLGNLVLPDSGWHTFTLSSDDGSNLYIDGGAPLINNDGIHGVQTKSNSKLLKYGIHTIELDYYSYSGQQALVLNEDGALMGASGFFH